MIRGAAAFGVALAVVAASLAGCATRGPAAGPGLPLAPAGSLAIASPDFTDHGALPQSVTCDGAGASPELDVAGVPAGASVALVVGDPDAPIPQAPQQNFTHWIAWDARAAGGAATFPAGHAAPGSVEGKNGGGSDGWTPPCPPAGSTAHRYFFTALAVNGTLGLAAGATRAQLEGALQGRVLAEAALVGCYARAPTPVLSCG
jgi:Raf kinase inhibitor-like YbhB/YbcL family protein